MEEYKKIIESFPGKMGLMVTDFSGKVLAKENKDEVFSTASVIKIFLLGALLDACEHGGKNLNDMVHVENTERAKGTGVLKELKSDICLSVFDLAMLMIIISDNVATNILVDYLGGVESLNGFFGRIGLKKTRMNRKVSADPAVTAATPLGETTPSETAEYLRRVYTGEILSQKSVNIFLEICSRQQLKNAFVREISSVPSAHKTGTFDRARNDVGYLFPENGKNIIFAAFTDSDNDEERGVDALGYVTLGRLGKCLYEELCKEHSC